MIDKMTKCPVCGVGYFARSLNLHITKMAGREALRYFVRRVNETEENLAVKPLFLEDIPFADIFEKSPHWKYHRANPRIKKQVFEL